MDSKVDFDTLQEEHRQWQETNFNGEQEPHRLFWGVAEECGEVTRAVLKCVQGIRGTPDEHLKDFRDGIGDIGIYFTGLCTSTKRSLWDIARYTVGRASTENEAIYAARRAKYPVMVTPVYNLGCCELLAPAIANNDEELRKLVTTGIVATPERPVLVTKFFSTTGISENKDLIYQMSELFVHLALISKLSVSGSSSFGEIKTMHLIDFSTCVNNLSILVTGESMWSHTFRTWKGIVKKRDWVADSVEGGGHTH